MVINLNVCALRQYDNPWHQGHIRNSQGCLFEYASFHPEIEALIMNQHDLNTFVSFFFSFSL